MSERDGEAARRTPDGSDCSRVPLSCCIIARNEERYIRRCLESVCFADECVVVIDSRSSDATGEIARELGDRRGEANRLANLGRAQNQLGELETTRESWQAALSIYQELEDRNATQVLLWLRDLGPEPVATAPMESHG